MERLKTIGFLLLLLQLTIRAQVPDDVDSLKLLLDKQVNDTIKVQMLNQLAEDHLYIDHEKIYDYAKQALELSEVANYQKGIALSYNNLGTYFRTKGIYDESIDYYFNALDIMEKLNDEVGIARAYNLIGILYYYLENYPLSLEYYLMAMEINVRQNDVKWIAGNSNNVGMILERQGRYDEALEYYFKSLEMNIQLGNKSWMANNYGNIGSLYLEMDQPEKSLDYFNKRLAIKEEQQDIDGLARSNFLIGSYYLKIKDPAAAIPFLEKSHEQALQSKSLPILDDSSEGLSIAYGLTTDYANALKFEKLNKVYGDSLKLASNMEKITRLQMQYQHQKDQQISILKHDKSKIIQGLLAIALFFVLVFILLIFNRQRIKSKQHSIEHNKLTLGNRLLQEELEFKENMLQDNINYLLTINELLSNTISKFNDLKSNSKPENQKIIKEIIHNLQSGINDDIWEEFELRFNQIHKDFYQRLNARFPDLSTNDKKLCAFLKLQMTTKEISAITSLSIKSIETARSRLRKKLNLKDKPEKIADFLNKI